MGDGGGSGDDENKGPPATPAGADGYRSEAYSFDSTALERAAKAAKVNICIMHSTTVH